MNVRRLASLLFLIFLNIGIGFIYMHSSGIATLTNTFSNDMILYNYNTSVSTTTSAPITLVSDEQPTAVSSTSPSRSIVKLHAYDFLLSASHVCANSTKVRGKISLLILVCSSVSNSKERSAIRQSWGSVASSNNNTEYVRLAFLLGTTNSTSLQQKVEEESAQHSDIIQQDFIDSYQNLTLKSIMLLKWVTLFCPNVHYVLKTDDDMYINVANLINALLRLPLKSNVMYGILFRRAKPNRNSHAKWFVPKNQFKGEVFPDYLSGTGYVMSRDVAPKLLQASTILPFLVMEDVFITGLCASEIGVKRYNVKGFAHWRRPPTGCAFKDSITGHHVSISDMYKIWKDLQKKNLTCRRVKRKTIAKRHEIRECSIGCSNG